MCILLSLSWLGVVTFKTRVIMHVSGYRKDEVQRVSERHPTTKTLHHQFRFIQHGMQ